MKHTLHQSMTALLAGLVLGGNALAQTALPGKLEAESYASMAGVGLEATTDVGGGSDVAWIDAGDSMTYWVRPASAGWYTVQYRVASALGGGQVVLMQNGKAISEATALPYTGGWQNWVSVKSHVFLTAGAQSLTVQARNGGFNLNWISFSPETSGATLPALHQLGKYWVDSSGKRVNLRGVNLGNWLAQEMWMMQSNLTNNGTAIGDQCTLESVLTGRFGAAEKERLMSAYRDSWITARDFDLIKSMGMNLVRLPFLSSLIEDEAHPYTVRADGWKYLDYAINEAEKRGLYVILDLHGAVGGQAADGEQHDGCVGPAQLWTNTSYRDRTKWLWGMIANRYKQRGAVAGYDLLNEPWGTDTATMASFAYELVHAVRAQDPGHMIILPGHYQGIDAYGNPATRGLSNVAFSMHFYPGLWGWNEVQGAAAQANMHANWLLCNPDGSGESCDWNNKLTASNTPFLIGEFQPWTLTGSYGGQMTRKSYDTFNLYGWAATSWAYKTVSYGGSSGDTGNWGWGLVTNANQGGYAALDVGSASSAAIESYFRAFGTQALVRNENVAYWMNWQPKTGQRIEAEMFANHSGMRMETTADTGGGFNVSYIDANDWMSYPISVPKTGWYSLQFRVASPNNGGQLVLSKNASDLAALAVPNTGGWQNWTTITGTVYLTAGPQELAIFARTGGWNINWWSLTPQ